MQTYTTLTLKSSNQKVGPIPVSTTSANSCPNECPLKGTNCYARFGALSWYWKKIPKIGMLWEQFCEAVRQIPSGTYARWNQAGDLPQNSKGKIHKTKLRQLVDACRHLKSWTYTHYDPRDPHNAQAISEANQSPGITINLSANNLSEADQFVELGIGPVTTILSYDCPDRGNTTPAGRPIVVCPAQTTDITCAKCRLCQVKHRKSIIGFKAHGPAKKRLSNSLDV